jgi:hypothetical protein
MSDVTPEADEILVRVIAAVAMRSRDEQIAIMRTCLAVAEMPDLSDSEQLRARDALR